MSDDELKALFESMQKENAAGRAEASRRFDAVEQRLDETILRFDTVEQRLDETNRHFDVVGQRFAEARRQSDVVVEHLGARFDTLAEGLSALDGKFERRFERMEAKFELTASDTQAMIKFSHAELDRRVRSLEESRHALEETVTNLETRVERLESSSH